MSRTTPMLAAALAVTPVALLWWTCRGADLDRRLPARAGGELAAAIALGSGVSFDKGSLEITSHDRDEVRVVADITGWGEYAVELDVREHEGDVVVTGRVDGFLHWMFGGPTVDVRIWVPPAYSVTARVDGGPLLLEDLVGPIHARVAGSDVTLRRAEGEVKLTASDGDIAIEDVEGRLEIESSDASVEISGLRGELWVRTEGGSIAIASATGNVDVTTGRGSVEIERVRGDVRAVSERGRIQVGRVEGNVDVETERGSVEIADLDGSVHARSGRGGIEVEFLGDPSGVIETARGSIRVAIPARSGFDLHAESARGSVDLDTDFELENDARTGGEGLPEVSSGARDLAQRRRELGLEIAAEVRQKVREHLERGLRDGDWEADWNWSWDQPDWSWEERGWGSASARPGRRDRGRGERVVAVVNGGGAPLRLHTERGSIQVEKR